MNPYYQIIIKTLVIINTILILPALFGLLMSFSIAIGHLWGIIPLISLLLGMFNAWYLFIMQYHKKAWVYNLIISIYSMILFTIPLLSKDINFLENGYFGFFIWPAIMSATSFYVLLNFYSYEKAKR